MAFIGDAGRVDGSWELTIHVTDLQQDCRLRVKGDLHIGGLMLNLVQTLDIAQDWSDHALWWPDRNGWLLRTRSTLDQCGVQADAILHFTPMHKTVQVQLPDLQVRELRANFSAKCFSAVVMLCKQLGIRHPEEMSVLRKWDRDDLKKVAKEMTRFKKKKDQGELTPAPPSANNSFNSSATSADGRLSPYPSRSPMSASPNSTLNRSGGGSPNNTLNGTGSPGSLHSLAFDGYLEPNSPTVPSKDSFQSLLRPKSVEDKALVNCAWLDSSRSLMEQGVQENDCIMLKFKYFTFYDLNPKYDAIRINQIYEQAKWSLIAEEVDCTEAEMMVFAALQVQIQHQLGVPQSDSVDGNGPGPLPVETDEVAAALADLQCSLEGNAVSTPNDITNVPELADFVQFFKPKKLTLKGSKTYWTVFRDTHLSFYRNKESTTGTPVIKINVKGCEIQPDVSLATKKYGIKLFVPDSEAADSMSEIYLRLRTEDQYCEWMAACKVASKGCTMADSSYQSEVAALQSFLSMQHRSSTPTLDPSEVDIQLEYFIAPRFIQKMKHKTIMNRIMAAHANVKSLDLIEAKLAYIKAWQSLSDFGITYVRIRMTNSKKDELLGIASDRVIRMDLNTGAALKTWPYSKMQSWHVNWENQTVILDFENQKVTFAPIECSCKTVHEYIGGYIFLATRSQDKNQSLNEELFHKLTGGWS